MQVCINTRKWTQLNGNDQREPGDNPKYLQVYQQAYCLTLGEKKKLQFQNIIFHQHTTFFFFACETRLPQLQRACRAQSQQNAPSPEHNPTEQGAGLKARQLATQQQGQKRGSRQSHSAYTQHFFLARHTFLPLHFTKKAPSSRNDASPLPALP